MTIRVAVCMPTTGRAQQARRCIEGLLSQAQPQGVDLFVVAAVPEDDSETLGMVAALWDVVDGLLLVKRAPGSTAVDGWNEAAARARSSASSLDGPGPDWFVLGADDLVFHPGWLEMALRVVELTGAQVVGFDDGGHTCIEQYAPHYMCSRWWAEETQEGFFVPPVYKSWWFDREVCERAREMGLYTAATGAVLEHKHPDWKTAPMDETYRQAWPLHDVDRATYTARKMEWVKPHRKRLELQDA